MISPIFSSYQKTPQQASSGGDGLPVVSALTHQEKEGFVPGFELDHIYQRESLVDIYVEDIVSALRIPDTNSKHFCQF